VPPEVSVSFINLSFSRAGSGTAALKWVRLGLVPDVEDFEMGVRGFPHVYESAWNGGASCNSNGFSEH
jgi:hypothetical protein